MAHVILYTVTEFLSPQLYSFFITMQASNTRFVKVHINITDQDSPFNIFVLICALGLTGYCRLYAKHTADSWINIQ
jgi:hypothetical protein